MFTLNYFAAMVLDLRKNKLLSMIFTLAVIWSSTFNLYAQRISFEIGTLGYYKNYFFKNNASVKQYWLNNGFPLYGNVQYQFKDSTKIQVGAARADMVASMKGPYLSPSKDSARILHYMRFLEIPVVFNFKAKRLHKYIWFTTHLGLSFRSSRNMIIPKLLPYYGNAYYKGYFDFYQSYHQGIILKAGIQLGISNKKRKNYVVLGYMFNYASPIWRVPNRHNYMEGVKNFYDKGISATLNLGLQFRLW